MEVKRIGLKAFHILSGTVPEIPFISLRFERAWCVSVCIIKLLPQDSDAYAHASCSHTFEVK